MKWTITAPPIVKGVEQPKSFFLTEFTPNTVRSFSNKVAEAIELGQHVLPVYIESPGGDLYSLKGILSLMDSAREKGLQIATITAGQAMSAGAFVFCYGCPNLRFAGSEATIMLHSVIATMGEAKIAEHKMSIETVLKEQDVIFNKISRHLKKKGDWLKKELGKRNDNDWFFSAQEGQKLGIVEIIGIPRFSFNITAEVSASIL